MRVAKDVDTFNQSGHFVPGVHCNRSRSIALYSPITHILHKSIKKGQAANAGKSSLKDPGDPLVARIETWIKQTNVCPSIRHFNLQNAVISGYFDPG